MSGHSKWASIKHKKGALDAKRGQIFSRISKEITIAAKSGGGNPDMNPRLRTALLTARGQNMPADNIDRAIKKGTGELPGVSYEEILYEGYAPGGVAVKVRCLTDSKNRTASEIRMIFSKKNGSMAGAGSVAWMFERKGYFTVKTTDIAEDDLFAIVTDAGAEDMVNEGEFYAITTAPENFEKVRAALEAAKITPAVAESTELPKNTVKVEGKDAEHVLKLIEALEEHDDVQNVFANFDISDETLEKMKD